MRVFIIILKQPHNLLIYLIRLFLMSAISINQCTFKGMELEKQLLTAPWREMIQLMITMKGTFWLAVI